MVGCAPVVFEHQASEEPADFRGDAVFSATRWSYPSGRIEPGMITAERVLQTIVAAVDEFNQGLPADKQIAPTPEAILFGEQGKMDSLGLATLVVLSEQKIHEEFGCALSLADEKAMSQKRSPFRTVGTMADYVTQLLKEPGN